MWYKGQPGDAPIRPGCCPAVELFSILNVYGEPADLADSLTRSHLAAVVLGAPPPRTEPHDDIRDRAEI